MGQEAETHYVPHKPVWTVLAIEDLMLTALSVEELIGFGETEPK